MLFALTQTNPISSTAACESSTNTLTVSYSGIYEYLKCPYSYYLARVLCVTPQVSPLMAYGSAMHEGWWYLINSSHRITTTLIISTKKLLLLNEPLFFPIQMMLKMYTLTLMYTHHIFIGAAVAVRRPLQQGLAKLAFINAMDTSNVTV